MKMLLKMSVAAALLSAASVPVFAQTVTVVTPPATSTGITQTADATNGSGVIVEVFDAATGHSLTEWLGMNFTQFRPGAQTPAGGETLDFGILGGSTVWSNFVTAEGGTANLQFVVEAGNNSNTSAAALETTVSANNNPTNTSVNSAVGSLAQVPGILTGNTGTNPCNSVNPCVANASTDSGYTVPQMGPNGGGHLGTTSTSGAVGTSLAFYEFVQNGTGLNASKPATQTQYANATGAASWTLGANGDLTYTVPAPAAVPLPAAAWLLGSGLLGLLGIGRRNRPVA